MFARLFAVASLVAFAVATDDPCDAGSSLQCCKGVSTVSEYNPTAQSQGLTPVVPDDGTLVGTNCSSPFFGSISYCQGDKEPLCCKYNGTTSTGCYPIVIVDL
ncbi:hydrophobin [Suillus paluster]|uniref:hydrophobin n=1 Tax=Suillus paluster TaxID=48578 RepID=UPI001B85E26D|nr:hydrophobin [Suillus paluster]KAG1733363.1 hydrophobin [Suillus paluster]